MLHFTFGENLLSHQKYQNIMNMIVGISFFVFVFFAFYVFTNSFNCYILARTYFIFLEKHPRPNLKVLQYQIWTSVKTLENFCYERQILVLVCKLFVLILD